VKNPLTVHVAVARPGASVETVEVDAVALFLTPGIAKTALATLERQMLEEARRKDATADSVLTLTREIEEIRDAIPQLERVRKLITRVSKEHFEASPPAVPSTE
jgi:hypothetical protein